MLKINDFLFNDHTIENPCEYDTWEPVDKYDFNEWVKVLVGPESGGGHWYQVHICNHSALKRINDKKYIFTVSSWTNVGSLIEELEKYVNRLFPDGEDSPHNFQELSKHWLWEYAKNS